MRQRNLVGLLVTMLAGASAQAATAPVVRPLREAAELATVLAGGGIVRCELSLDDLDREQQQALRDWVAGGGTLWCETSVSRLFGLRTEPTAPREKIGRARRACGVGAAGYVAQVEELFYRFGQRGEVVLEAPGACPLLLSSDPTVLRRDRPLVAVELWYGLGRLIHVPGQIHVDRLHGKKFAGNLELFSPRREDEVRVPADQLALAAHQAEEVTQSTVAAPERAALNARLVLAAYRLWLAEHLTATDRPDEALPHLQAVAAELPEEPAVYLAVARWNEKKGRALPAEEAYRRATEGYAKLKLQVPGPDARQLRVPWPMFAAGFNAAGELVAQVDKQRAEEVYARLGFLLGMDLYRAGNWDSAEAKWAAAARLRPSWPLPPYHLGQLHYSRAVYVGQSNRDRVQRLQAASGLFLKASMAAETEEFPSAGKQAADAWSKACTEEALALTSQPPDALLTDHFVLRYDRADQRFNLGPTLNQLSAAWERAYESLVPLGIWLDPVEVFVYGDAVAMNEALPRVGVTRQQAEMVATVGGRIYSYLAIRELAPFARHELVHVMVNRVTEDGLAPPLWLVEGLATTAELDPSRAATARIEMNRGNVMTVAQLNDPQVMYDIRRRDHAHGQSQVMCEALLQRFGTDQVVPYLQLVGWGTAPDAVFSQWTNLSQDAFLAALLRGQLGAR